MISPRPTPICRRAFGIALALPLLTLFATGAAHLAAAEPTDGALYAAYSPGEPRLNVSVLTASPAPHEVRLSVADVTTLEGSPDITFPGEIYLPPNPAIPAAPLPGRLLMFLHRNATDPAWDLVMEFPADASGSWHLNGTFLPLSGEIRPRVIVPVAKLPSGENSLLINAAESPLPQVYYRRLLTPNPAAGGQSFTVSVTAREARLELWRVPENEDARAIARLDVSRAASPVAPRPQIDVARATWSDREHLFTALQGVAQNLLRARVADTRPRFSGGFNLVYDAEHEAWRVPHWVWSWGPSITFLQDVAKKLPADRPAPRAAYREAALAAGLRSLEWVQADPDHPAHGVVAVRWAFSPDTPRGSVEYFSTADSLFLAGWGWMPLYEATGHAPFLSFTRGLEAAAVRLMDAYPVVPQDWVTERDRWTPHTLDESIFGMIGFTALHAATGDPAVQANGVRFIESHLEHMSQPKGFLDRGWDRATGNAFWDADVKGHLWVLLGYLDAYRLNGDKRYLELARALGNEIAAAQGDDGAWTDAFHPPADGDRINDRAIAMGAWMFYELYRLGGDDAHLATARRALTWCLRHQDFGDNPDLFGAIPNETPMAHLAPRQMTILYTTQFFGLALLAELDQPLP